MTKLGFGLALTLSACLAVTACGKKDKAPTGQVVATVDGSGALTGLRFGPRAVALPPERLAELVLSAASEAASAATRRAARLVDGLHHG